MCVTCGMLQTRTTRITGRPRTLALTIEGRRLGAGQQSDMVYNYNYNYNYNYRHYSYRHYKQFQILQLQTIQTIQLQSHIGVNLWHI